MVWSVVAALVAALYIGGLHQLVWANQAPQADHPASDALVSVATDGFPADDDSASPSISADGRFVAFQSFASNLMPGATLGVSHIYLHNRQTGGTTLVSVGPDGSPADDDSTSPSISTDGRFVAFQSFASNLVPGITLGMSHIYVHDRQTGSTRLVSVSPDGSPADDDSTSPSISADGRFVAFQSFASNLAPGATVGISHIYVHDRQTGMIKLASVASGGSAADDDSASPSVSADGRFLAFQSFAASLTPGGTVGATNVFVHDRQSGVTGWVGGGSSPAFSADGRFVAFQSLDPHGVPSVLVYDRQTETTVRVSVSSDGSPADDDSTSPTISADGRFVAFQSLAANMTPGATLGMSHVFIHDRQAGETVLVSVSPGRSPADDDSESPTISADGRFVAFQSFASNLIPGDTLGTLDILAVRNPLTLKPGDADGDALVTVDDLRIVARALGTSPVTDRRADLNNDDQVDVLDLVEVAMNLER